MLYRYFMIFLILNFFMCFLQLKGQTTDSLREGNISASVSFNGSLFMDTLSQNGFIYKPEGKGAIYAAASWMSATSPQGALRVAAHDYALPTVPLSSISSDYAPGPVAANYGSVSYARRYQRVWRVTRAQINKHQRDFNDINYFMPEAIQNWPAQGDTANGEAAQLAPFEDVNDNGIYEPMQGEHPKIAGDEAIYAIFNDSNRVNPLFAGRPLGVEIHLMAYTFNRPADTALSNSVFLHYRVINRSKRNYSKFIYGQWNDFDLGNGVDDAMQSDSAFQMAVVFNGDLDDDGPLGFGRQVPAVACMDLNRNSKGHMVYFNAGFASNPHITHPDDAQDVNNYLNHRWKDGTTLKLDSPNGDGYSKDTNLPVITWIFNSWLPSLIGDKRSLLNSKPQPLPAGGALCYDYAYVLARDTSGNDLFASVNKLETFIPRVRQAYKNEYLECSQRTFNLPETHRTSALLVEVFPNPARHQVRLQFAERQKKLTAKLYSLNGQLLVQRSWKKVQRAQLEFDLPAGLYLLELQNDTGDRFRQKLQIGGRGE